MSPDHVEIMNRLLAASTELAQTAASLPRNYDIAYRLYDARADRTEYWLMHLGQDGVWFALEPSDSADLTFVGDYHRMIETTRKSRVGEKGDAGLEVVGDLAVLQEIAEVFGVAQKLATVPVRWP